MCSENLQTTLPMPVAHAALTLHSRAAALAAVQDAAGRMRGPLTSSSTAANTAASSKYTVGPEQAEAAQGRRHLPRSTAATSTSAHNAAGHMRGPLTRCAPWINKPELALLRMPCHGWQYDVEVLYAVRNAAGHMRGPFTSLRTSIDHLPWNTSRSVGNRWA